MEERPQKIKLVVSDFHLGSGHRTEDGALNILEDFFHDREFIEFLQYYSSGVYEEVDVEVIINGDFFNLLMIDYEEVDADVVTELIALRRMKAILEGHKATMNTLKYFHSLPGKSVTFVMGNHDPGVLFPSVQEQIRSYVGDDVRIFLDRYEFDGVYIEHGNQHEVANAYSSKDRFLTRGLPEPVLNQPWGTYYLVHVVNHIKRNKPHFDKVLPFGSYLKLSLLHDPILFFKIIGMTLKFFFESRLFGDPRRNTSFRQTLQIVAEAPIFPDLDDAAERILMTRDDIHTVIFGHNHRPVYRHFAEQKIYINTGTWNEITHLEIERFGTRLDCTFALLEYDSDERIQSSLKVWRGRRKLANELNVT